MRGSPGVACRRVGDDGGGGDARDGDQGLDCGRGMRRGEVSKVGSRKVVVSASPARVNRTRTRLRAPRARSILLRGDAFRWMLISRLQRR